MKTTTTLILLILTIALNAQKYEHHELTKSCNVHEIIETKVPINCESFHKFQVKSICAACMGVVCVFIIPWIGVSMIIMDGINYYINITGRRNFIVIKYKEKHLKIRK